jgi:hypothetical protein
LTLWRLFPSSQLLSLLAGRNVYWQPPGGRPVLILPIKTAKVRKFAFVGQKQSLVEKVSDPAVSVASLYQQHAQIQYPKEERNPNPTEPPISRETSSINILKNRRPIYP